MKIMKLIQLSLQQRLLHYLCRMHLVRRTYYYIYKIKHEVVKITIIGIALNLTLSLLLISQFGLIGVIYGAFISRTVMQLIGRRANNEINVVKNGSIERIFDR